jgi:acyl-coenzyme A thioesterase PaaI-like protein
MNMKVVQDYYDEQVAYCYGCGRLNDNGLHIRTKWNGEEGICTFNPQPQHIAIPGFVYGGLIASLIDCHSIGTAAAAIYALENRPVDSQPALRYVTASLHVDYLRPTPLGPPLVLRARPTDIIDQGRRVYVACSVFADDIETCRGTVIAAKMPEKFLTGLTG